MSYIGQHALQPSILPTTDVLLLSTTSILPAYSKTTGSRAEYTMSGGQGRRVKTGLNGYDHLLRRSEGEGLVNGVGVVMGPGALRADKRRG